jgi:hypothetical protein
VWNLVLRGSTPGTAAKPGLECVPDPPVLGPGGVKWILRLAAAGGEGACVDIVEISKSDDLGVIADLDRKALPREKLLSPRGQTRDLLKVPSI